MKWHGEEVGQEEIVRPSLSPLLRVSRLHNARIATADHMLPRRSQLCFSGKPYAFRIQRELRSDLTGHPSNDGVDLTVNVYSMSAGAIKRKNRFFGEAIIGESIMRHLPLTYSTIPLRRRRCDTLDCAYVNFRLRRSTGRELLVSCLKISGLPFDHHKQHGSPLSLHVRFEVLHSRRPIGQLKASLCVYELNEGHINWPQRDRLAILVPLASPAIHEPLHGAVLRISLSCGDNSAKDVSAAELPLESLVAEAKSSSTCGSFSSKCSVTLCLARAGKATQVYVVFLLGLATASLYTYGRSLTVRSTGTSQRNANRVSGQHLQTKMAFREHECKAKSESANHGETCMRDIEGADTEHSSQETETLTSVSLGPPFGENEKILDAEWEDLGGDVPGAAATLNIFKPALLRESLEISVCNDNAMNADTTVGQASCDLQNVVAAIRASTPTFRFSSINLSEEGSGELKQLNFTAWLERNRYFCISIQCARVNSTLAGQISNKKIAGGETYIEFNLGGVKINTLRRAETQWHNDVPILLPTTVAVLERRRLIIKLWYADEVSQVLVGVASTSLADIATSNQRNPVRFTLPLLCRGVEHLGLRRLVSFTLFCTEITAPIGRDYLDAATALAACSIAPHPHPVPLRAKLRVQNICLEKPPMIGPNHESRERYCTICVGGTSSRTTIKAMTGHSCDWGGELISINTDLDELTGNLIQITIIDRVPAESGAALGRAELHLTPRRCVLHSSQLLGAAGECPSKKVALQLKCPDQKMSGILMFDLDILVEDKSRSSKLELMTSTKFPPTDGCSSACLGETIGNSSGFYSGGTIYTRVERAIDDEIDIVKQNLGSVTIGGNATPPEKTLGGDSFLVGAYDDNAAFAESRRRCQPYVPRDRNELRVVVLRARGLYLKDRRRIRACGHSAKAHRNEESDQPGKPPLGNSGLESNGSSDPYVALRVRGVGDVELQKTSVAYSTLDPEWGEQFILPAYESVAGDSEPPYLELVVHNHDEFTSHDLMGCALLPLCGAALPGTFKEGSISEDWLQLTDGTTNASCSAHEVITWSASADTTFIPSIGGSQQGRAARAVRNLATGNALDP